MAVSLIRIDDRLIHGQVIQGWVKHLDIKRIVVCNDEAASDETRRALLEMAVPAEVGINILSVTLAVQASQEARFTKEDVLFLFTVPQDCLRFLRLGDRLNRSMWAPCDSRPGKNMFWKRFTLNDEEVLA
ncbi:Phosphotransferase system, sorbose subfamily IIB component, partial [sediment metagenome]